MKKIILATGIAAAFVWTAASMEQTCSPDFEGEHVLTQTSDTDYPQSSELEDGRDESQCEDNESQCDDECGRRMGPPPEGREGRRHRMGPPPEGREGRGHRMGPPPEGREGRGHRMGPPRKGKLDGAEDCGL